MQFVAAILAFWVILLAAVLWMLLAPGSSGFEQPAPPDPYEAELREWRKAVHDWTRDN